MSEIALQLEGVTKRFRRFRHAGLRALSVLGVPVPSRYYDVFTALDHVSLTVHKGEKVALVGRNGAGKSTLLRLISKQMQADSGTLQVAGTLQTLMELGTGFHPDFTGLQNIRSALAYQGVSGAQVAAIEQEIIEFTELEEFIHRPVREYSAGMYARLAFAVATSVEPDILIIDEILGAGDAYFVGKSIRRMKELTSRGATILFVSHDMSAVQMLCERAIWIERGRVRQDGDVLTISKAYAASVREEEELRLRMRSMALSRASAAALMGQESLELYRLVGEGGNPPAQPLLVSDIRFRAGELAWQSVDMGAFGQPSQIIDEPGATNWSRLAEQGGKLCRSFADHGGRFLHAPWQIDWRGLPGTGRVVEITYRPSVEVAFERYDAGEKAYGPVAQLAPGEGWRTEQFMLPDRAVEDAGMAPEALDLEPLTALDRYGEGPIGIQAFGFFDGNGVRRHTLVSGEPAMAVLQFAATQPVHDPVAVVAIYRPDGTCALQSFSNREGATLGVLQETGMLNVQYHPLLLGPGDYIVSVALFKELPLHSNSEPPAYDLHDRCYALKILPPEGIAVALGMVNQPAQWSVA